MESKEAYTPAEFAKMVETHLGVESSLIKLQHEMTEARDAMYAAGKREQFNGYMSHTLKARIDTLTCALRHTYETEIPENVRESLKVANLLPCFDFQIEITK